MNISYNNRTDLLYIRLDETPQEVMNQRVSEDVVLDIGEGNRIIGIEILKASEHVNLAHLFPIDYQIEPPTAFAGA